MTKEEEIKEKILKTIKPYVNEWVDSSYKEMERDLLDEIKNCFLESQLQQNKVEERNIINNRCNCNDYEPIDIKLCSNCNGYCE